ncbi:metal dependent phosphohydrolase [Anaeromyxobacter sp. K]|uniref:HDOD domain-containing protein n=1 Tax=Anaeromyxobacter sp. (strain K) TaxID=447217 RepID=UPI00015F8907|nr:HDOD domain-containing protein [Anaeromyxobacter sp. K]ACG73067.1 metal dependent phosphohydrolase [Anaeromyxobacter sp. K]
MTDLDSAMVDLVARQQVKVPPYPAVAFQIDALLRTQDYGLDDLARLVASDQVLAADVLRCANAALYARGAPVASVKQAVQRIGATDVARLALASGLGAHVLAAGRLAPLRRRVWMDALASALLCQALARGRGLSPEIAFSAGLLHDFGKVVAIACLEDLLARREGAVPRQASEWAAIAERFHVEMGVVMAARWELPPVLADVVAQHHAERIGAAADPRYVETVAAVDEVVRLLADRTSVAADDLAEAALLDAAERPLVVRAIEVLPGFVAAFERPEAWKADVGASLIAPPPGPAPSAGHPLPYLMTLRLGGTEHVFDIRAMGGAQCVVSGPRALPENVLLEMKIACDPALRGFATVKLAWAEHGRSLMLVQPYGLPAEALARWKALFEGAAAAAA